MEQIRRLKGMQDLSSSQWAAFHQGVKVLQEFFDSCGYRGIEVPVLEETELFLRKSGGELAAKMYTFTDPGGRRISLRPEFTASVVRAFIEGYEGEPLPCRIQYVGPVFRYAPDEEGGYRQFTQLGVELLGSDSPDADAEVLAIASKGLSQLGIQGFVLTLGHVGVITTLLDQLQISERARLFLLSHISELKQGASSVAPVRQRALELGLLGRDDESDALSQLVRGLSDQEARNLVRGFLKEAVSGPLGQRTPEEVFNRYLYKLRGSDDPSRVEQALELATALATIHGSPEAALAEAGRVITQHGLNTQALAPLEHLLELLNTYDLEGTTVTVDMGLARGIAYYTGVIFEISHPSLTGLPTLGGGGRYDGLVKALGGTGDVPALGFAYAVERVLELCQEPEEALQESSIPGSGSSLLPPGHTGSRSSS